MEIQPYKVGDEHQILELFEKSFNKQMSLEYWKWRFESNPYTNNLYIDLMWDNGKLVGHYAVSPVEMVIDGNIKNTALSMTTMTHPEYGGKGIFSKLAENLYSKLKNDGYEMVWGFPNTNSHYGFKKNLFWNDITLQPILSLTAERLNTNDYNSEYYFESDFSLKKVEVFGDQKGTVKINRTMNYMNWRYCNNPSNKYRIISLSENENVSAVYKKINSFSQNQKFEIDILELSFDNNIVLLIQLLLSILREEGADILKFNLWSTLFSEQQILLEKVGFRFSTPLTFLSYRCFTNNPIVGDLKNWELSLGYSDVF